MFTIYGVPTLYACMRNDYGSGTSMLCVCKKKMNLNFVMYKTCIAMDERFRAQILLLKF